jgi:flagellar FliJ protein
MSHSSSTKMLHELASRHLEQAAKKLAVANSYVLNAVEKLTTLNGYRNDYIARYEYSLSNGVKIDLLKNHQKFIQKLADAITGQEHLIENLNKTAKQEMFAWQSQQQKKMSYDVLLQRLKLKKNVLETKLDQKLMDEFAARAKKK